MKVYNSSQLVIKWLESIMDMKSLQADIETKIQEINNPIIVRLSIPE